MPIFKYFGCKWNTAVFKIEKSRDIENLTKLSVFNAWKVFN